MSWDALKRNQGTALRLSYTRADLDQSSKGEAGFVFEPPRHFCRSRDTSAISLVLAIMTARRTDASDGRLVDVTQSASDCAQLLPMTDAVEANLGRKPEQVLADGGYCSDENLAGLEARITIDAYVATGRDRDAAACTEHGRGRWA